MKPQSILILVVDAIFFIIVFLLGFRLIIRFFGANPLSPFVNWIYSTSDPLLMPFMGIFPTITLDGRFVLEFSTLFALIVYSLIAYAITEIILRMRTIEREGE